MFCNGRRLSRRPFPLCPLGATAPVGPRVAARPFLWPAFTVDIELPYRQLPLHSSPVLCWCGVPRGPLSFQRPAKALDIWLAIYYA